VPPAGVGQILPKEVRLDGVQYAAVGVDVDADRGLWIARIPGPAADLVAPCLFVAAFVGVRSLCQSRLRIGAGEMPGKEQEPEAHTVERSENPGSVPHASVTPQLAPLVPTAEGLVSAEEDAM